MGEAVSRALRKSRVDVVCDLSAIAKGYAVDRVAEALSEQGYRDHLVEVGGEIRARGQRQDGGVWRVAIERPDAGDGPVGEGPPSEWTDVMDTVAGASRSAYRALVHDDPGFPTFFQLATPIDVIERLREADRSAVHNVDWESYYVNRDEGDGHARVSTRLIVLVPQEAVSRGWLEEAARLWSVSEAMLADA